MTSPARRWAIIQLISLLSLPFLVQAVAASWIGPDLEVALLEAPPAPSALMPDGAARPGAHFGSVGVASILNAAVTLHLPVVLKDYIPGQAPTPPSLFSPTPTSTATPTPTATRTPTPTATYTPTPTPTLACATATQGCVTVLVYDDLNLNGQRDVSTEPLLDGAVISVTNIDNIEAPRPVSVYTTDGRSEPHPFYLSPGSYTIHEENPEDYESVTVDDWDVSVVANRVINIEFGDWPGILEVVARSADRTAHNQQTRSSPDQTGQLCAWSFEDRDEDGIKDPWDPIVPGSEISVLDPGPPAFPIASAVTQPGDIGPRCFTLLPGTYYVEEIEPAGYVSTTPDQRGAVVAADRRLDVIFGNRRQPRRIVVIEGIFRQGDRDERIVIANRGTTAQDLSGWRIRSYPEDYSHWFTFPDGYILDAGARVTVHSGRKAEDYKNPPSDLFWWPFPVWDDDGDVGFLYDREGYIVDIECYGNKCTQETPTPLPTHTPTSTPALPGSPTSTPPIRTPTATPVPLTPIATPVPEAAVVIADLQPFDRDEVVVLVNNWTGPLDLNHWSLVSREGGEAYDFDFPVPFVLQPGQEVRIHSGPDAFSHPPFDLFWTVVPIWDDFGDTAVLFDPAGNQIDSLCYGGILDCRLRISQIERDDSNEYIEIVNRTAFPQDLTNWRIESITGEEWYWFPSGFRLDQRGTVGSTVRIRSGPNAIANPPTDLLWYDGSDTPASQPVWADIGDSGVLYDAQGAIVDVFCYGVAECFTPTPAPVASPSPTPTPRSTPPGQRPLPGEHVVIETIRFSTTDEFITLKNVGTQTVVLFDWEIRSIRGDQWYRFPEPILLHPNKTVRVHSGPSAHVDPPTDLLWYDGSDVLPGTLIWNDLADAAVLYGRVRDIKDVYCYGYDSCDVVIAEVSGCSLNESIAIWNQAIVHRNLTGWQIWSLTGGEIFRFPDGYILPPGGTVLVHSGPEAFCDPPNNILWHDPQSCPFDPRLRAGPEIWDDAQQDRAVLVDNNGILVSTFLHLPCQ